MAVYLDYNASAPVDARVLDRMIDVYRSHYGNADSRTHSFGTDAKEIVSNARKTIAEVLGVDSTDIIFTSGSTESNNMATIGLLECALESGRNHFITTSIEHKSILEAMKYLQSKRCVVDFVSPDETGRIKPNQILDLVTDKTLLVSMMHVNSETGIIQPIEEIGEALAGTKTYFHIDATQGFGKLNDSLRRAKYNMMSITAHKLGGPQGIGALILRRDKSYRRPSVKPLLFGGQQERGFRPGIKASLLDAIKGLEYQINGDPQYCISNTINISFSGVDAESYFVALKDEYAFSNGSACNSGSHAPSYVLSAMGLDEKRVNEAIRMSWDASVNPDFKALCEFIKSLV